MDVEPLGIAEIVSHTIDMEVTNRCNANCTFCPRAQTPHQGVMNDETFTQALARVVEFREASLSHNGNDVKLSFCGLGEQLINSRLTDFISRATAEGFATSTCSNGALLDEELGAALVDAGLHRMYINCGDLGDTYTEVYDVPFDRLVENVDRFLEIAGDRCETHIVLVDHRDDDEHLDRIRAFWLERGVTHFFRSPMLNRSGTLDLPAFDAAHARHRAEAVAYYAEMDSEPVCAAAVAYPFIGYDGTYYLCSSDWEKKVGFGTVFERSIGETIAARFDTVVSGWPICAGCSQEPVNAMSRLIERDGHPHRRAIVRKIQADRTTNLRAYIDDWNASHVATPRRRIPVRAT